MTIDSLVKTGYLAFGAGGAGGLWLFIHELSYGGAHPGTQLSGVLEVAGLAIAAVATGGVVGIAALRRLAIADRDVKKSAT